MATGDFLSPLFDPLLSLGPFWAIFTLSLVLSVIITFIYKWMTNQDEMKSLKEKTKELQKKMKENRNNHQKLLEIQKEAMEVNGKYMMKSMRPTLVTFLPVILIFAWLSGSLAYHPLAVGNTFDVSAEFEGVDGQMISLRTTDGLELLSDSNVTVKDNKAVWNMKAQKLGTHTLTFDYYGNQFYQKVEVSGTIGDYEPPEQKIRKSPLKTIEVGLTPVRPMGSFSIFGWKPNWLWTYIIFSMIFSLSLRKLMKLH